MADISKIILPNGTKYDIKDATARSALNAKSKIVSERLNAFDPAKDEEAIIDRLEDAFYFADRRWSVTAIQTDANGNQTSLSQLEISYLFDLTENNRQNVPISGKLVVTIDFSETGTFPNYPYGYAYLSFYHKNHPKSVTARVYGKHTGSESFWQDLPSTLNPISTDAACQWIVTQRSMYNMQKIEFTILADDSQAASLSEIAYYLTRADKNKDMPYVSKLKAETLYYPITAPEFVGDLTGNSSTATALKNARSIQTNLASSSAVNFNGSANVTPGVTGTLGVDHGGTGQTSAKNAANAFMNALDTGSSTPVDNDYYISQYVSGGTTTKTYHRRPMSALWEYVKGKISSVLGLTNASYSGSAAKVNNHTVNKDVPSDAKFTDTWKANSSTSEGYVASGANQANKVWKTNENGVPAWRDDDNTTYTAGTNVQISNNVISATDTKYTAASATPKMDGTGTVGTSAKYAREDHVHPSDTTKVDKVTGKGLSTNDFTDALETKLNGIAAGAEVNVQSDWNETNTSSDAFVKNKPTIPTKTSELTNDSNFAVDANYVHTDNNYTSTEKTKLAGVATGAEANVQSDWNVTDTASDAFIKNKPTIPAYDVATTDDYGLVKLSHKYDVAVAGAGIVASQNALHNARADLINSRAPNNHASTATTYGQGNATNYGHVKLSDTYASKQSSAAAANGVGASQNALYNAYNALHTRLTKIESAAATYPNVTLDNGASMTIGGSSANPGHIRFVTGEPGMTSQAEFIMEKDGRISSRSRTRSSTTASWGSWGAWKYL